MVKTLSCVKLKALYERRFNTPTIVFLFLNCPNI